MNAEALLEERNQLCRLVKTFVHQGLRRFASWQHERIAFHHFRDKDLLESDSVLESAGRVAGPENKAAATVNQADFRV